MKSTQKKSWNEEWRSEKKKILLRKRKAIVNEDKPKKINRAEGENETTSK